MNPPTTNFVKDLQDTVQSLDRSHGLLDTVDTLKLILAIRRLSRIVYQHGTVGISNLHAVEVIRNFNSALAEIKEDE